MPKLYPLANGRELGDLRPGMRTRPKMEAMTRDELVGNLTDIVHATRARFTSEPGELAKIS